MGEPLRIMGVIVFRYICRLSCIKMRLLFVLVLLSFSAFLNAQNFSRGSLHPVNSNFDELNPVLSPDGKTLFFTIANHPMNIGGKRDPGDIWMASWMGDQWSPPTHAGKALNDRTYNAVAGLSPDGRELFLLSHYDHSGSAARTQGISVSLKSDHGWSRPENIVIPYFQNKSTFLSGTISPDLGVFVFSAETYGTHGVDDLYVTFQENGRWTEPRNLGPGINTQFQELSPSLSRDGRTLYFSSNGRKGSGSFDVFAATRLDDTWNQWSVPVNLGPDINTEGRELYFHEYQEFGLSLLTSTKDSDGYGDIRVNHAPNVSPDTSLAVADTLKEVYSDTRTIPVETPVETERSDVIKIYGKVTNSKTGEAVSATISFTGPAFDQPVTSSVTGYHTEVPSTGSYSVRIEAPGYVSDLEKLDIKSYEMRELEMNFSLQPVEVGTTVNLKDVLFVQTKTDLLPESFDELDMVVDFLKQNPNVKIELAGHTDNRGVHSDNVKLSQLRVNSVKKYLVSKGIDGKRISGKGYGGTRPIASNETEETRRMNRRVEFTIRKF